MINEPGKKIYISGASGRLGRSVLKRIPEAIPLVRRPYGLPNEKMTDFSMNDLKEILSNAKAILHLAGSMKFNSKKVLWQTNFDLTKTIVDSAPPQCKIIFASSISVYGKKLAQIPANEQTECNPDSEYSKSKYASEQLVRAHPEHVILRIGTMYGPQFGDYLMVLKKIEEGKMLIIGDGNNFIPFTHVDDIAAAIEKSLERGKGTYLVCGDAETQSNIYKIAATGLGVDPPKKKISYTIAYWFAWLRNKLGKTGFTTEHIAILGSNRSFNCSKAKAEFDFSPKPIKEGIAQMVKVLKGI
jgi:nucleoside-diphosphate-sugar epimerase